jgi:predicted PolB exonuclease-like 3'-5' exonuclease
MFRTVANEVWAFDAEWVPDLVVGRVLYRLPESMSDREVVEEMWQRNGATEADPKPYLKPILCCVVSIPAVIRRVMANGKVKLCLHTLPQNEARETDCDEAVILSRFLMGVDQRKPQLVGCNSQAADLKIFLSGLAARGTFWRILYDGYIW